MVCFCGCQAIKNEADVYGSYELTSRDGKVLLEVGADHSYSETIRSSNAPDQKNSGHWQWRDGRVCFDALPVPRSVRKGGKTILEMNPDSPENFVKVSAVTARQ